VLPRDRRQPPGRPCTSSSQSCAPRSGSTTTSTSTTLEIAGGFYSARQYVWVERAEPAGNHTLAAFKLARGDRWHLHYDMGDDWHFYGRVLTLPAEIAAALRAFERALGGTRPPPATDPGVPTTSLRKPTLPVSRRPVSRRAERRIGSSLF